MSRNYLALAAGVALALLASWMLHSSGEPPSVALQSDGPPPGNEPAEALPKRSPPAATERRVKPPEPDRVRETFPENVANIDIDGSVTVDEDGNVVADRRLRDLFEFFISLERRRTPAEIQALLSEHVARRYPPFVVAQVEELFEQYGNYKVALTEEEFFTGALLERASEGALPGDDLRQALATKRELEREYFTEEQATSLFGDENDYMAYVLDKNHRARDGLDDARGQISDVDRSAVESYEQQHRQLQELDEINQLEGKEKNRARVERFGEQAARRLAVLDEQRAAWQEKLGDYRQYEAELAARLDLSDQARERMRKTYVAGVFSPGERRRLASAPQTP